MLAFVLSCMSNILGNLNGYSETWWAVNQVSVLEVIVMLVTNVHW